MPTPGRFRGMYYGPSIYGLSGGGGPSTYDIKANNAGWCARFMALSTLDIKSVRVSWSAVTIGTGTMTLRIETIDATTGKPTGTLYDANAVIASITPAAGITTYTFASLPTTGLTIGTEYGVVLLTTAAFTTCTLNISAANWGNLVTITPGQSLTSATGSTRSTFAEVGNAIPVVSFVLEDDSEDPFNDAPLGNYSSFGIYGTRGLAGKFVISHTIKVMGVQAFFSKTGTPAGDIRCRIFDSADNVVSGTTVTIDKDSIITASGGASRLFPFSPLVTLQPGTYRIVLDSASSENSSNCWDGRIANPLNAAVTAASPFISSTTTDLTAGPIVWTDNSTGQLPVMNLFLDDIISAPTMSRLRTGY